MLAAFRRRGGSKYGAVKTEVGGKVFASKAEAKRYAELLLLVRAKRIRDLECQPRFCVLQGFTDLNGTKYRPVVYVGDFRYTDDRGVTVVEDVKGFETAVFKLKEKMFRHVFPDIDFRVLGRKGGK